MSSKSLCIPSDKCAFYDYWHEKVYFNLNLSLLNMKIFWKHVEYCNYSKSKDIDILFIGASIIENMIYTEVINVFLSYSKYNLSFHLDVEWLAETCN